MDEFFYRHPRGLIENDENILIRLTGRYFKMVSCTIEGRIPLRLDGPEASVTLENIQWTFRRQSRRIAYAEFFANRASDSWSVEKAVERAMDEVLQASVYAGGVERFKTSVSDYFERFKKGHVLLLGDFGPEGIERIQRIAELLGALGYYGFTLQDVREVPEYDLRQKLTAVAPVCRFVVVDDSSRAGQAAELPIVEMLRVTTIVMRLRGSQSTFVTRGLSATSRTILEIEYDFARHRKGLERSRPMGRIHDWRTTGPLLPELSVEIRLRRRANQPLESCLHQSLVGAIHNKSFFFFEVATGKDRASRAG